MDKAALALETSLESAVIANRHDKGRKHAQGPSIFFPVDTPQLTDKADPDKSNTDPAPQDCAAAGANDYASTIFATSQGWSSFVQDYTRVADEYTEETKLGPSKVQLQSVDRLWQPLKPKVAAQLATAYQRTAETDENWHNPLHCRRLPP